MKSIFEDVESSFMENREGVFFIYQRPLLRVVKITVVDENKKVVPIPTVFGMARKHSEENWNSLSGLVGCFWMMSPGPNLPNNRTSFERGMALGIMTERFRINRGADVLTEITDLTAEQFDAEERRLKAAP